MFDSYLPFYPGQTSLRQMLKSSFFFLFIFQMGLWAQGVVELEIDLNQPQVKTRSLGQKNSAITAKSIKKRKRLQPVNPPLTQNHLVIKALDNKGRVVDKIYQYDSSRIRVEGANYEDKVGQKTKGTFLKQNLLLKFNHNKKIKKVEVYRPIWQNSSFKLKLLLAFDLPRRTIRSKRISTRGIRARSIKPKLKTIKHNGSSKKKVDIVIIGDGYTKSQMKKWRKDAAKKMKELFANEPFKSYENFFNVHRIDVVSNESGAGYSRAFSKQNALGSYLNCNKIKRLLCADYKTVSKTINSVLSYDQQDIKLIFVNDKRYGGAGGEYATATSDGSPIGVVLHEIGHSFAGFADEYDANGYPCDISNEPSAPNVTIETDKSKVKWRHFKDTGIFEGAKYCKKGIYRPYKDSMMRNIYGKWGDLHTKVLISKITSLGQGRIKPGKFSNALDDEITDKRKGPEEDITESTDTFDDLPDIKENEQESDEEQGYGAKTLRPNQRVLAYWQKDKKWYPAKFAGYEKQKAKVIWFDNSGLSYLLAQGIRPLNWQRGDTIECRWSKNKRFYSGNIQQISGAKLTIAWQDGDEPEEKNLGDCRQVILE